ncbi:MULTISPECIES: hypothetical protein [Bacteria]|uniref:hypothetical protein n=1 Tax=Bacteria TaxID=2 RepID=UPI0036DD651F
MSAAVALTLLISFVARCTVWRRRSTRSMTVAVGFLTLGTAALPVVGGAVLDPALQSLTGYANWSDLISGLLMGVACAGLLEFVIAACGLGVSPGVIRYLTAIWVQILLMLWLTTSASNYSVDWTPEIETVGVGLYWLWLLHLPLGTMLALATLTVRVVPRSSGRVRLAFSLLGVGAAAGVAYCSASAAAVVIPGANFFVRNQEVISPATRGVAMAALALAGLCGVVSSRRIRQKQKGERTRGTDRRSVD